MRGKSPWFGLAMLVTFAVTAGAGTSVSVHKRLASKPYPCDIPHYESDEQAALHGKFEKVCSIVSEENTSVNGHAEAKAWTEIQRAACGCGADAVIVRYVAGGGPNVSISAEAISIGDSK